MVGRCRQKVDHVRQPRCGTDVNQPIMHESIDTARGLCGGRLQRLLSIGPKIRLCQDTKSHCLEDNRQDRHEQQRQGQLATHGIRAELPRDKIDARNSQDDDNGWHVGV